MQDELNTYAKVARHSCLKAEFLKERRKICHRVGMVALGEVQSSVL